MNNNFFLEIVRATHIEDYKLYVIFNNGVEKFVDFYDLLFHNDYPVFLPLRDVENFRQFKVTDTLEWEDGTVDIAPETVYEIGETVKTDSVAEPTTNYNTLKD